MKKIIDLICITSIGSSMICVIGLFVIGIGNNGLIKISSVFGIFPWPMEWILLNSPIIFFGIVWLSGGYSQLMTQKAPYLFGKSAFAVLGVALLAVELMRFFYKR